MERKVSNETDELLLGLIREGDEIALSRLYDRKSRFVFSLAYNLLGNKDDAEEITEEVFFRLWEKADSFDKSRGSVLAWLAIITRRLAIDKTRSRQFKSRSKEVSLEAVDAASNLGDRHEKGARNIESMVDTDRISEALNQLSNTQREMIKLSYYEGLSHSKIADRLDAPLGTVKTRIREAVIQLRRILGVEV